MSPACTPFGLELHPEKTRLIQCGRFAIEHRRRSGEGKPETFNFLGFTHICGSIHKTGRFTVMRKTIGKRLAAKLKIIKAELRKRMHEPIQGTGEWLRAVVRGYYNYHAVPGNFSRLRSFRHDVISFAVGGRLWRGQRVLRREVFDRIVAQYLPTPMILHPYPLERFRATHPR
jgi:RNA-directed DNA polymerase